MPPEPARPAGPRIIGLVGGIASGKSTVARILAAAGWEWVEADTLAREVLESTELRPRLAQLFGPEVVDDSGAVDRARIAKVVFAEPKLREALEALIHPRVRRRIEERLAAAERRGARVVLDIPLLLENGWQDRCDEVVFVDTPAAIRRERAIARGLPADDWERRERTQLSIDEKRRRSDRIVPNADGAEALRAALADLIEEPPASSEGEVSANQDDDDDRE